uniref:Uncharacterized protein n=1 Tax=viral metagenome TaxID=1070528 RepID=A0A6M3X644_9ZZZZ
MIETMKPGDYEWDLQQWKEMMCHRTKKYMKLSDIDLPEPFNLCELNGMVIHVGYHCNGCPYF